MKRPETYLSPSLFAVALAARIAAVFLGVVFGNDSADYLRQAEAITAGRLEIGFPNGYPILIAPLVALIPGHSLGLALGVLNAALSAAAAPLAFMMSRRLCDNTALAALGALAVALWPHQINYARHVLTEAPTAFWITLFCAAALLWQPALSGAALAAAILTRPSFVLCAPFVTVALQASGRRRDALSFVLTLLLVIVAYVATQWALMGSSGLSGNLAINIAVAAQWSPFTPNFHVPTPESSFDAARTYLDALTIDPQHFLATRALNIWELFGPWPLENTRGMAPRLLIGLRFPVFIFCGVGLFCLARQRKWIELAALGTPIGAVAFVHSLLFATPRFTVPVEPLLIVGSIIGIRAIYSTRPILVTP